MSDLERLRQELERLQNERRRMQHELEQRPLERRAQSETFQKGVESCAFLSSVENALMSMGNEAFFTELRTRSSDILMLIALCEDDAREAGPLVENDAHWLGNRIRRIL